MGAGTGGGTAGGTEGVVHHGPEDLRRLVRDRIVEFDEEVPTARTAAALLGCDVGAIANSLVFATDAEPVLVVTSGAHRVDPDRVAVLLGVGAVQRASRRYVGEVTGQPVGGVAPVGHPRPVRTVVDVWLQRYDVVWAGAGTRHAMFPTSFAELLRITGGIAADVGD